MKRFIFGIFFSAITHIFAASDLMELPHYSDLKAFERPRMLCHFLFNKFGGNLFTIDDQEGARWTGRIHILKPIINPGEIDPSKGEYASVNMLFLRNDLFFLDGMPTCGTSGAIIKKKYELLKFLGDSKQEIIAEIDFCTADKIIEAPIVNVDKQERYTCSLCSVQ